MKRLSDSLNIIINKLKYEINEENDSIISKIKKLEIFIFFKLLSLSPVSLPHKNKSHRSKNESEKKFIISSLSLSNCILSIDGTKPNKILENNGGSYIDLTNLTMSYYKKSDLLPVIFDLKNLKELILKLYNLKSKNKFELVLFSNTKLQAFPIYYGNTTRKHCGFEKLFHKIVNTYIQNIPSTLNEIFKMILNESNKVNEENLKKTGGGEIEETELSESEQYFKMWEDIFRYTGELPRDCSCKQYSKALYHRCVVLGKELRGIRPVHKIGCDKKNKKIELEKLN